MINAEAKTIQGACPMCQTNGSYQHDPLCPIGKIGLTYSPLSYKWHLAEVAQSDNSKLNASLQKYPNYERTGYFWKVSIVIKIVTSFGPNSFGYDRKFDTAQEACNFITSVQNK